MDTWRARTWEKIKDFIGIMDDVGDFIDVTKKLQVKLEKTVNNFETKKRLLTERLTTVKKSQADDIPPRVYKELFGGFFDIQTDVNDYIKKFTNLYKQMQSFKVETKAEVTMKETTMRQMKQQVVKLVDFKDKYKDVMKQIEFYKSIWKEHRRQEILKFSKKAALILGVFIGVTAGVVMVHKQAQAATAKAQAKHKAIEKAKRDKETKKKAEETKKKAEETKKKAEETRRKQKLLKIAQITFSEKAGDILIQLDKDLTKYETSYFNVLNKSVDIVVNMIKTHFTKEKIKQAIYTRKVDELLQRKDQIVTLKSIRLHKHEAYIKFKEILLNNYNKATRLIGFPTLVKQAENQVDKYKNKNKVFAELKQFRTTFGEIGKLKVTGITDVGSLQRRLLALHRKGNEDLKRLKNAYEKNIQQNKKEALALIKKLPPLSSVINFAAINKKYLALNLVSYRR